MHSQISQAIELTMVTVFPKIDFQDIHKNMLPYFLKYFLFNNTNNCSLIKKNYFTVSDKLTYFRSKGVQILFSSYEYSSHRFNSKAFLSSDETEKREILE